MSIFAAYGSDTEKEEQGAWFTIRGGYRVLLARRNSRRSQRALERARSPYKEMFEAYTAGDESAVPDEINDRVTAQWVANGILLDWEGPNGEKYWLGKDGQQLSFSPETARFLLEDRSLHDLRDEIIRKSGDFDGYRLRDEEEAEKNSSPGTASTRTTPKLNKPSSSASQTADAASAH